MGIDVRNTHIGKLQYQGEHEITGETHVQLDGLDFSNAEAYYFIANLNEVSGNDINVSFVVQTGGSTWQTTANEYYYQRVEANAGAFAAARANSNIFMIASANDPFIVEGILDQDADGMPRLIVSRSSVRDPADIRIYWGTCVRNDGTAATGFRIASDQANGLTGTLTVWRIIK